MNAPWNQIKGAAKRALRNWTPIGTVDEAESDLDDILTGIIDEYVKLLMSMSNEYVKFKTYSITLVECQM